ncbi:MAG: DUF502 domain-containing protein [Dokdonella sp.]
MTMRERLKPILATWLTGLLAVLPLAITLILVGWVVAFLNQFLGPNSMFGRTFSGFSQYLAGSDVLAWMLGTLLVIGLIYLLGVAVRKQLKGPFAGVIDNTLRRVPLVGSVYTLVERFVAVIGDRKTADIRAMSPVWCFFGGDGVAVLGLQPNPSPIEIDGRMYLTVLVPTAPVPVGGGLLYVPVEWVKPAHFGIEALTGIYLSMGINLPPAMQQHVATGEVPVRADLPGIATTVTVSDKPR